MTLIVCLLKTLVLIDTKIGGLPWAPLGHPPGCKDTETYDFNAAHANTQQSMIGLAAFTLGVKFIKICAFFLPTLTRPFLGWLVLCISMVHRILTYLPINYTHMLCID